MKAFAAFTEYLRLGANRSAPEVAANLGKGLLALRKWQERHAWVERATEWDAHLAEQEQAAAAIFVRERGLEWAKRREALREKEWALAEKLMAKAEEMLSSPKVRWGGGDIARLLEVAQKLGRMAAGLETERKVQEVTGDGGGPVKIGIEVSFEAELKKVYGQVIDERQIEDVGEGAGGSGGGSPPAGSGAEPRSEVAEVPA